MWSITVEVVIVEQFWIVLSKTEKKGELLAERREYWKGEVKVLVIYRLFQTISIHCVYGEKVIGY